MKKSILMILVSLTLAACSFPADSASPPTTLPSAAPQFTLIPSQTFTPVSAATQTPAPTTVPSFCNDSRSRELINSLANAIQSTDGALLASLVSPSLGMDVRFYRDGNAIHYDVEHAEFVFETTYQADWGLSYGSGEATIGAFKEIVLPSLKQVFTPNAEIVCDQLKTGGVTYNPIWPYQNMHFYSVHFAGTDVYGGLDWQTWAVGMDNPGGKPTIAALVHYVWEP